MVGDRKGHPLDNCEPRSVACQHITGLRGHAHRRAHWPLAEKERPHTFPIISQLIGQTQLNYSRCAMQGVIMTIRKMATLRHAHLPSVLTNCLLSPVLPQPIDSWDCQSDGNGCRQAHTASLSWLERHIFLSFFFCKYFFPKEEKKQKAKDSHNKINAWRFTQSKNI